MDVDKFDYPKSIGIDEIMSNAIRKSSDAICNL